MSEFDYAYALSNFLFMLGAALCISVLAVIGALANNAFRDTSRAVSGAAVLLLIGIVALSLSTGFNGRPPSACSAKQEAADGVND